VADDVNLTQKEHEAIPGNNVYDRRSTVRDMHSNGWLHHNRIHVEDMLVPITGALQCDRCIALGS
jgi:hypothetical protein